VLPIVRDFGNSALGSPVDAGSPGRNRFHCANTLGDDVRIDRVERDSEAPDAARARGNAAIPKVDAEEVCIRRPVEEREVMALAPV
jgi:hypothetical protein